MIQLACMFDLGLICGPVLVAGVAICGVYKASSANKDAEVTECSGETE